MPTHLTALLVIDMQRGAFDGERCAPIDAAHRLVDHTRLLVDAARAAAAPIVFVQHLGATDAVFEEGSPQGEIHGRLRPLASEKVICKRASSAFDGTDLSIWLDSRGVRRLVVCGLQSEHCVFNTATAALERGFSVVIAQDGHGTWSCAGVTAEAISNRINIELRDTGAALLASTELADRLRSGAV